MCAGSLLVPWAPATGQGARPPRASRGDEAGSLGPVLPAPHRQEEVGSAPALPPTSAGPACRLLPHLLSPCAPPQPPRGKGRPGGGQAAGIHSPCSVRSWPEGPGAGMSTSAG